jgi:NAD+ synthase
VAGTPNRLEWDLGFFVKQGDGAADLKPIAHLYKSQVYELARYLAVPEEIIQRPPTTDTYSLAQTQEEFYFCLPYPVMDLVLYGERNGYTPDEIAPIVGLQAGQVARVFRDLEAKRRVAMYLHAPAALVQELEPAQAERQLGPGSDSHYP